MLNFMIKEMQVKKLEALLSDSTFLIFKINTFSFPFVKFTESLSTFMAVRLLYVGLCTLISTS